MPTLEELLAAGAHFGHRVSRWNPKMAPYIFTTKNRFHIIDLDKTLGKLKQAEEFVSSVAKRGGIILFVGTKRQAKDIIRTQAKAAGMPYVSERWLGGTLTNFKTIQRSIKKLFSREELLKSSRIDSYTKKERLMIEREVAKNTVLFEGIRDMKKLPDAMFVVDSNADKIAVQEARLTGVPVIAITDTNVDPALIDYLIPANDDAMKTIELITSRISGAIRDSKLVTQEQEKEPVKEEKAKKE